MYWVDSTTERIQAANLTGRRWKTSYLLIAIAFSMEASRTGAGPGSGQAVLDGPRDGKDASEQTWMELRSKTLSVQNWSIQPHCAGLDRDKMYLDGLGDTQDPAGESGRDGGGRPRHGIVSATWLGVGPGQMMYWDATGTDQIRRANLDGTEGGRPRQFRIGVSRRTGAGPGRGQDVLDGLGAHKIQRANLDGTEVEDLVTSGLD